MNLGISSSFLEMPRSRDISAGRNIVEQIPSTVFPKSIAQKLDVQTTMTVVNAATRIAAVVMIFFPLFVLSSRSPAGVWNTTMATFMTRETMPKSTLGQPILSTR